MVLGPDEPIVVYYVSNSGHLRLADSILRRGMQSIEYVCFDGVLKLGLEFGFAANG